VSGWAVPAIALVLLVFAAVSKRLAGTPITAPIVFLTAGLLLGARALGVVDADAAGEAVKLMAEVTLGLVLFSDAAKVDMRSLRKELSVPARLLGLGLPMTIAAGFGVGVLLFGGTAAWPEALLLAVILAPTDAALGQSVVTLPSLPTRVRQGLNVESGLNDGICVPLFLIALAVAHAQSGEIAGGDNASGSLATAPATSGVQLVAAQIGYGVLAGVIAGVVSATILILTARGAGIEAAWAQIVPVAAAALAFTAAVAVGGSGFIAAFVGGLSFGVIRRRVGGDVSHLTEQLGDLSSAVTFIVFAAVMLGPALGLLSWPVLAYAVISLTVVRMVPVGVSLLGTHAGWPTVAFIGWFGPRGLASIVFSILILEEPQALPHQDVLMTTAIVTIGLSAVVHGLTAAPLAERYASWFRGHPRPETLRLEAG
jgi:NhaP-type Na+/H+ or K+/H+ antiporter